MDLLVEEMGSPKYDVLEIRVLRWPLLCGGCEGDLRAHGAHLYDLGGHIVAGAPKFSHLPHIYNDRCETNMANVD